MSNIGENQTLDEPVTSLGKKSFLRRTMKFFFWVFVVLYFLAAAIILAARYIVTPYIANSEQKIEQLLTEQIGRKVSIGDLKAGWYQISPFFTIKEFQIDGTADTPPITIDSITAQLSYRSLLYFSPIFTSINLEKPRLDLELIGPDKLSLNGFIIDASTEKDSSEPNAGLLWFLRQRDITVNEGRLDFTDKTTNAPTLSLFNISVAVKNYPLSKHFALRAVPPVSLGQPIDIRAQFKGPGIPTNQIKKWNGEIYANLPYVNFEELKHWVPALQKDIYGLGAGRLWVNLNQWQPQGVKFDGVLSDFQIKLGENLEPLHLDYLRGSFEGNVTPEKVGFQTDDLTIKFKNKENPISLQTNFNLNLDKNGTPTSGDLKLSEINLKSVSELFPSLPVSADVKEFIEKRNLSGTLKNTDIAWVGSFEQPLSFRGKIDFANLQSDGQSGKNGKIWLPGFRNFSGHIEGTEKSGTISLNSQDAEVAFPGIFPVASFHLDTLDLNASWTRDKHLAVKVDNLHVANADVEGSARGSYTKDDTELGFINVTGDVSRGTLTSAWKYVPLIAGEETIDWLKRGILAGTGSDGKLTLRGPLHEFAWEQSLEHLFSVSFKFKDGRLNVYPNQKKLADGSWDKKVVWPIFTDISGEGFFEGDRMKIVANEGKFKDASLEQATVTIPSFSADTVWLNIVAGAQGPANTFIDYVNHSPIKEYTSDVFGKASGSGNVGLKLALNLPLDGEGSELIKGSVDLKDTTLAFNQYYLPELQKINGTVDFSDRGVDGKNLKAVAYGEPIQASLLTGDKGELLVKASGTANASLLKDFLPGKWNQSVINKYFSGKTKFTADATVTEKSTIVEVESPLTGLELKLPAPLHKAAGTALPLTVRVALKGTNQDIAFKGGQLLSGDLSLKNGNLISGSIGMPSAPSKPSKGISININTPEVNFDKWSEFWEHISPKNDKKKLAFPPINSVRIHIGNLIANNFNQTNLNILADPTSTGWEAQINSDQIKGTVDWKKFGPRMQPLLTVNFSKLYIPKALDSLAEKSKPVEIEGGYPAINAQIGDLTYGDFNLGKVVLEAHNTVSRDGLLWMITNLRVNNPDCQLTSTGSWQKNFNGSNRTTLLVNENISNLGRTLARFGKPGLIRGGNGTIKGELAWDGTPLGFTPQLFDGKLNILLKKGEILQIQPGAGAKLLSLLSLQSLTRFITLDLRDLYSKGFTFSTIEGKIQITDGIMKVNNLSMIGAQATVITNGKINIPKETQNLDILVLPDINAAGASVALAIANPLVGIGSFIAQMVLKDPLSKIFSFEYLVTGTWSDPIVKKKETHKSPESIVEDLLP